MRSIIQQVLVALFVFLALPARADFMSGFNAYQAGDIKTALSEWQRAANAGDAASQFRLGQLYERGEGVLQDYVEAHKWYNLAAGGGEPTAREAMQALEARMSPRDVASARAAAQAFKPGATAPAARAAAPQAQAPAAPRPATQAEAATPKPKPPAVPPSPAATATAPEAAPQPLFEAAQSCEFLLRYKDKGSGGVRDLALYEPLVAPGFLSLGSYGQFDYTPPFGCVTVVRPLGGKLPDGRDPFVAPAGYRLVWTDRNSGAEMDGSIWQPQPPNADYVCLGSVAQSGYTQPNVGSYACVHKCLVKEVRTTAPLWTDEGTGATEQVSVFGLSGANVIYAVPGRGSPPVLQDFNPQARCR